MADKYPEIDTPALLKFIRLYEYLARTDPLYEFDAALATSELVNHRGLSLTARDCVSRDCEFVSDIYRGIGPVPEHTGWGYYTTLRDLMLAGF